MKHHCYLATQNEKKKFDKKKQLWEQYKNILAEKMAKKKAEAKETHREVTRFFNAVILILFYLETRNSQKQN